MQTGSAEDGGDRGVGSKLAGPAAITVSLTEWWGPFAGRGARVQCGDRHIVLVNAGDKTLEIGRVEADPVVRERDGIPVSMNVRARLAEGEATAGSEAVNVPPGAHLDVVLSGEGTVRAGVYVSRVRVSPIGEPALDIPVRIEVSTSFAWAVACIVAGLVTLAVLKLLSGESDVEWRLNEALALRREMHEAVERRPLPPDSIGDFEVADEAVSEAIGRLSAHRSFDFVDRRPQDAQTAMARAKEHSASLQKALAGKRTGQMEVERLQADWESLEKQLPTLKQRAERFAPLRHSGRDTFPVLVDKFLYGFDAYYLDVPAQIILELLEPHVERARLLLSAGEGERARQLATSVHRWVRRAASTIDKHLRLAIAWESLGSEMVGRHEWIRQRMSVVALRADERLQIETSLSTATDRLRDTPTLADFQESYRLLQQAETQLLQAERDAVVGRFAQAMQAVQDETSTATIDRALAEISRDPDRSLPAKQRNLSRIMALWRDRIESSNEPATRAALNAIVDQALQAIEAGELQNATPLFKQLIDGWQAYQGRRLEEAKRQVLEPYCRMSVASVGRQLAMTEQQQRLAVANAGAQAREQALDRVRLQLLRTTIDNCLEETVTASKTLVDIGGELFQAALADAEIAPEAKLDAARRSGSVEAVALAKQLMTDPRPLRLTPITPQEEHFVGRKIAFAIDNLDPAWGDGVAIVVQFGADGPWQRTTAEQLRQAGPVLRTFDRQESVEVTVTAASDFDPESGRASGQELGTGRTLVDIAPSPISAARRLADNLLNARFAVALLAALLIQLWRVRSSTSVFGASRKDYVEAFAVGLGVDATLRTVPEILPKIGLT